MKLTTCTLRLAAAAMLVATAAAQSYPRAQANDKRVDDLLRQMTLEEKVALIRGAAEPAATYQGQAGYLTGVPRLHIPSLRFADGPPGLLTRLPAPALTATMGLAATFSRHDAEENGRLIGLDARSLGIDVALEPFINLYRDITFGRGFNTYGEDPFLTGQLGAAEIRGIQSQDVMAMAKHFIGYEANRYNDFIGDQAMHEVYLAPFADAVDAGVSSVMCSYNRINGAWACGNGDTQKGLLKGELAFQGFIASDWGGVHSVDYINQGLDVEMPGVIRPERPASEAKPTFFVLKESEVIAPRAYKYEEMPGGRDSPVPEETTSESFQEPVPFSGDGTSFYAALRNGSVTEATITAAARRVLREMDRFGYLDGTQKHTITPQPVEVAARIIRKTSEDSAVLLVNRDHALPLQPQDLASVAMIGPTAGQVDAVGIFGERSGGLPQRQVSPVEALRRMAPSAHVTYAVADDMTGSPIPAALFSHEGKPGLLRTSGDARQTDSALDFTGQKALPANTTASWSGDLHIEKEGDYWLYLQALGARARISVDGKLIGRTSAGAGGMHGDTQQAAQDNGIPTTDGLDNVRRALHLQAGKHAITVELTPDSSNNPAQLRLNWYTPEMRQRDHLAAIQAAKSAHTAVVFVWGRRKPVFGLPGDQDRLIEEVAAVNPNTIVVINTSHPFAMPWLPRVKAVLQMWWPGDEGGWSTASVLLGKTNPAGRLPLTWGNRLTEYAATDPAHPERTANGVGGKVTYSEGVLVGYRWFDAQKIAPLFPFGHGLSYTRFVYSTVHVASKADGSADVSFTLTNSGAVAGDEVPQVYLEAPSSPIEGADFAPQTLAAFDRVTLKSGESKVVTLHIAARAFQYWSTHEKAWRTPAGKRTIHVGASSRDLRLQASF